MGMSGWRIGYVFTNEERLFQIFKVYQHLIAIDLRATA
jgi:aspartate/methionine/tyrosine aminotransferase